MKGIIAAVPGAQPVKAGFLMQLLWGKAGCIDTHNIDIYSKVFPDLDIPKGGGKKQKEKKVDIGVKKAASKST